MLVPVTVENRSYLAICLPTVNSKYEAKEIRDSILDVISSVLSNEETKSITGTSSFCTLLDIVSELNKDLELKQKGGTV